MITIIAPQSGARQTYWENTFSVSKCGFKVIRESDTGPFDVAHLNDDDKYRLTRFLAAFRTGGFVIGAGTECLADLSVVKFSGVVLGRMGTDLDDPNCIPDNVVFSEKGEELMLLAIAMVLRGCGRFSLRQAAEMYHHQYKDDLTQMLIANMRHQLGEIGKGKRSVVNVLPGHIFYPLDHTDNVHHNVLIRHLTGDNMLNRETAVDYFPTSLMVSYVIS